MNPMKDVEGVAETRLWLEKSKPHAHLHIIGRKSTKFQVDPIKDVGVVETSSLGQTAGQTE